MQQFSYSELVHAVKSCKPLAAEADRMAQKEGVLDLVCDNWEQRLKNCLTLQAYANADKESCFKEPWPADQQYKNQKVKDSKYVVRVNVVGKFTLHEGKHFVTTLGNEALTAIAQIMCGDLARYEVIESFKFSMDDCTPMVCNFCQKAERHFLDRNFKLIRRSPCIRDTKIFDGKLVKNMFQSTFVSDQTTFYGIATLELGQRCYWTTTEGPVQNVVRVGGKLLSYVVFKQNNLNRSESDEMVLGDDFAPEYAHVEAPPAVAVPATTVATPPAAAAVAAAVAPVGRREGGIRPTAQAFLDPSLKGVFGPDEWKRMTWKGIKRSCSESDEQLETCIPKKIQMKKESPDNNEFIVEDDRSQDDDDDEDNEELDLAVPDSVREIRENSSEDKDFVVEIVKERLI